MKPSKAAVEPHTKPEGMPAVNPRASLQADGATPRSVIPGLRYRIGVDGGGTQTRLRLCAADGKILAQAHAGPSALGQGAAPAWQAIQSALQQAACTAGVATPSPGECALAAGLSGAGSSPWVAAFRAADPGYAWLRVETDVDTALRGAFAGGPGVMLVGGTGSVALVRTPDGRQRQLGGWGWRHGDEGSGAWLGVQVLRHVHRVVDGRVAAGSLARAAQAVLGAQAQDLLAWQADMTQASVARLAPLVFEQAPHDPVAAALLDEAAAALAALVQAADPQATLPWVATGSVAERLIARAAAAKDAGAEAGFSSELLARRAQALGDALDGALLGLDLDGVRG